MGVTALAAIAIAREGSETVVFLYGSLSNASAADSAPLVLAGLGGLALALLTFYVLQLGGRAVVAAVFPGDRFCSLLLGASAVLSGVENRFPWIHPPALLDLGGTAALIDDMSPLAACWRRWWAIAPSRH